MMSYSYNRILSDEEEQPTTTCMKFTDITLSERACLVPYI